MASKRALAKAAKAAGQRSTSRTWWLIILMLSLAGWTAAIVVVRLAARLIGSWT